MSTVIAFFVLSWPLALIIIPIIALLFISQILYLVVTWKFVDLQKSRMENFSKVAVESINNIQVVKSLGIAASMERIFKQRLKNLNQQVIYNYSQIYFISIIIVIYRLKKLRMVLQAFLLSSGTPLMLISCIMCLYY